MVGFGVTFPLVYLKLRACGVDAEELLDRSEPMVLRAVGDYLVARGKETLPSVIAKLLIQSGETLALAESCTGGMIAAQLTDIPGASAFLERGAVTYADKAKVGWLKIPAWMIEQEGAVSASTARLMARGIRRVAASDFGLAVTGIAGPSGGTAGEAGRNGLHRPGDGERRAGPLPSFWRQPRRNPPFERLPCSRSPPPSSPGSPR